MSEGETAFADRRDTWLSPYRGMRFFRSLKWLLAGTLLYALLLLVAMAGNPGDAALPIVGPSLYLTPMFGLPYVLATLGRPGRTRRMLYFILLLPLVHVAANYLAWSYAIANFDQLDPGGDTRRNLIAGGIGGLAGAALAFALLNIVRLTLPGRRDLGTMALCTILLTALGAGLMAAGLHWTHPLPSIDHPGRTIEWYEIVHLPWQAVFGLCLAWLMRGPKAPRRRAKTPAIGTPPIVPGADSQAVAARLRGSINAE